MSFFPLRIPPGADLRKTLEDCLQAQAQTSAFVLSGIGSLDHARIRYAAQHEETLLAGPLEILSLAGSISSGGAHLHMSASSASGQVLGGHVCYGNTIRTTAEVLLVFVQGWRLSREYDSRTGYRELVARSEP